MNNLKIINRLSHKELAEKFITLNTGVKVISWQPLINDESEIYANTNQPTIRVELDDGNWLRVYVNKEFNEINWY